MLHRELTLTHYYFRWVPEGFGTGDCVIIADGLLHIIDYKYGVGIPVAAENNSQLMCYAAAALDTFECIYSIDRIKLSIYQPRRENVCTWETTKDELLKWADEILKALTDDNVKKWAFNASFERICLSRYLQRNYPEIFAVGASQEESRTDYLRPDSWYCDLVIRVQRSPSHT